MKIGYYDEYSPEISGLRHIIENVQLMNAEVRRFERIPDVLHVDVFLANMRANSKASYSSLVRLIPENPEIRFFVLDASNVHWELFRKEYHNLLRLPENLEELLSILDSYSKASSHT